MHKYYGWSVFTSMSIECFRLLACRVTVASIGALLILVLAPLPSQGQSIPEWKLAGSPTVEVGREDPTLHRVTDAVILDDGTIAVADAGNYRILLFSPAGQLLRVLGRKGEGPGDFRSVWMVTAHGDTILAHDPVLRRLSLWHSSGSLVATMSTPSIFEGHLTDLRTIQWPSRFLMVAIEAPAPDAQGLFVSLTSILLFELSTTEWTVLERRPQNYLYRSTVQDFGSETLRLPFLGTAQAGVQGHLYWFVPLDSALVEVADLRGRKIGGVRIPIEARRFNRSVVNTYRDSLLGLPSVKGSLSGERIRTAFNAMETPELAPRIGRVELDRAGGELWVEEFPKPGDRHGRWYVVDLAARVVRARVRIPHGMHLLHVQGCSAVFLVRSAYDEEQVKLYQISKRE